VNIAELVIGIAGITAGLKSLRDGLGDTESQTQWDMDKIMSSTPPRVKIYEVRTIEQRIRRILDLCRKGRDNPKIRELAVRAVSRKCGKDWCIPEKAYMAEIDAIYRCIRERVRYVRDTYGKDLFQSPMRTLQFAGGDCDDYSIIVASMLQSIGYPVRLRVIRTKGASDWNHIYNMVGVPPRNPSKWIPVDASVPMRAGWQAPRGMIADLRDFQVT
jgi:transglutaminase-like putative cysteine protease